MKQAEVKGTTLEEAISEWKKLGIKYCEMEFSCGGDSMNDYRFEFFGKGKLIESGLLDTFFEVQVFKNVTFYEASDGYYQGESGVVTIELNDDEKEFNYSKDAQAEFSETFTGILKIKLKKKEAEFIKKNVERILGGEDSNDATLVFKHDMILSDEEESIVKKLEDNIHSEANEFEIPDAEGEPSDWFNYNTSESVLKGLTIDEDNKLHIEVNRSYTIYRDSED